MPRTISSSFSAKDLKNYGILVLAGLVVAVSPPFSMSNSARVWAATVAGMSGIGLTVASFVRLGPSYRAGSSEALVALATASGSFVLHGVLALSASPLMFRSVMVGLAGAQFFLGFLIVLRLEELMRIDREP